MRDVYIRGMASALPGEPVDNDTMESVLGFVGGKPSKARKITLRSNGIEQRHYVLDPQTRVATMTNARLTAKAVEGLAGDGLDIMGIQTLACGTTTPDQLMPAHGAMVQGELGIPACEMVTTAGICISGAMAFKYAFLAVAAGDVEDAVATGSETVSPMMRAEYFEPESDAMIAALEKNPILAFEKDFLRWMLSDGAGAAWLSSKRPENGAPALRVKWIDMVSFAGVMETCMYGGAEKDEKGELHGWKEYAPEAWLTKSIFAIKQDVKLLNANAQEVTRKAARIILKERRDVDGSSIDWFLPHYSSHYFKPKIYDALKDAGCEIPDSRWYTNLTTKGNTGAASIYIMLEELFHSGRLKKGDNILCYVPESGRFSVSFIFLTVE